MMVTKQTTMKNRQQKRKKTYNLINSLTNSNLRQNFLNIIILISKMQSNLYVNIQILACYYYFFKH